MQVGSPLGSTARCKTVKLGTVVAPAVSTTRSPPDNANRNMSIDELVAQFMKLPLKALLHLRAVAGPLLSNRL